MKVDLAGLKKHLEEVRKEAADWNADGFDNGHTAGRKDLAYELLYRFFDDAPVS